MADATAQTPDTGQIEGTLSIAIYPGTEIMTGRTLREMTGHDNEPLDGLIPRPSTDRHDPLNWSPKWKFVTLACATVMSFSLNLGPLANAPMFGP